ncbi:MAG: hypothetical protein K8R87_00925 [Verrucomicrobia bacterium]|nr:hypothetical protein [Verrucomicrobiota bacterium]
MKTTLVIALTVFFGLFSYGAEEPSFEVWSYTGTDIYPSAIIATATVDWNAGRDDEPEADADKSEQMTWLGDKNGWVGAKVMNVPKGTKIKVEVSGDGWLKPSKTEVTVAKDEDEVLVMPKGVFDYDALHKVKQQKPANLNVKVSVNGKALDEQNEVVTLRSINECPFAVIFGEGDDATADDLSWMFAAYVNENHPWIDGILKEALEAKLVDSFDGYQSGDPEKVLAQVYAVWNIMQRHGMKYSDITNTPKSKFAAAQVVRFLDDSVAASQANCVDGSVIFASILTKLSIKCGLVLVPGHCFVCFDLDPNGDLDVSAADDERTVIGLETTMMGSNDLKPLSELKKIPAKQRDQLAKKESQASSGTFGNALEVASTVFSEHGDDFAEEGSDYQVIPIADAREFGIMPIGFSKEKP